MVARHVHTAHARRVALATHLLLALTKDLTVQTALTGVSLAPLSRAVRSAQRKFDDRPRDIRLHDLQHAAIHITRCATAPMPLGPLSRGRFAQLDFQAES